VTSPPYWGLRDYQVDGQIGLEKTPEEYVQKMVEVFREVRRVLRDDGTLFLNLGDSYVANGQGQSHSNSFGKERTNRPQESGGVVNQPNAQARKYGLKPKDLVGIPWRVAFALQADGWWLRQDIIWNKPNPMPESVTDRCTKSHEYIFLLTKSARYFYDSEAVKETNADPERTSFSPGKRRMSDDMVIASGDKHRGFGATGKSMAEYIGAGRNRRSVWTITTKPFSGAHFATFPEDIPEICIKAGTKKDDVVLDPFAGAGTTGWVAKRLGRKYILIELNEKYVKDHIEPRVESVDPLFT
jgi:DNA modification methylase